MLITTKDNREVYLRRLTTDDLENLLHYLHHLNDETKKRFSPHPFDKESISDFYEHSAIHWGYVAYSATINEIIAYSIIKLGYLEKDNLRMTSYGFPLNNNTDCAFAPSVADTWQGYGIGNQLFHFILADLKNKGIKRVILWGGVQADNDKAVRYYQNNGFRIVGKFVRNGENYDMILEVNLHEKTFKNH